VKREGNGEIKHFSPARDDNTWQEQVVRLHTGEYKLVETDTHGPETGRTQTGPPPPPNRNSKTGDMCCISFERRRRK
jgi:hypothetical protein